MPTSPNIYQVVTRQGISGVFGTNVYWYRNDTGIPTATAEILAQVFENTVITRALPFLSTGLIYTDLSVIRVSDPTDFFEKSYAAGALAGTVAGERMPAFVGLGFRSSKPPPSERRAFKRIMGIPEAVVNDQSIVTTYQADVDNFAAGLGTNLVSIDGPSFEPVVVKRPVKFGDPLVTYRAVPEWSFYGVTSQSSRKRPFS